MSRIDDEGTEQFDAGADEFSARMDYSHAYLYVFDSANWILNLLFGTLCQLIPIVGPIVFMGYQFEIVEKLHRDPRSTYPDFDFKNFVDYLTRGIWPFLTQLIVGLVLTPIILVLVFGVLILTGFARAAGGEEIAAVGSILAILLSAFLAVGAVIVFMLIMMPLVLRAGLSQNLAAAFNYAFVKDFVSSMWLEMILAQLFLAISGMIVMMLGMLIFCVGMYPAMTLFLMAQAHLYFQIYRLYLARGGMPIPLKESGSTA